MTATTKIPAQEMTKNLSEALVDQLRSCKTKQEILKFEEWFNRESDSVPLYEVICHLLRTRSISRGLAAKWMMALYENK